MNVVAINGSPRKNFSTAKLLEAFLDGAKSAAPDASAEIVHLYDLSYTGCRECYACKLKGGASYGRCGFRDGVTDALERTSLADVAVFGSPIFFHDVTGQMRSFLERLLYPFLSFKKGEGGVISPRKIRTAFVFAMNVTEERMKEYGYPDMISRTAALAERFFGHRPEILHAFDTYQYSDYGRYEVDMWDEAAKRRRRDEQFPKDLAAAFELGRKLAGLA